MTTDSAGTALAMFAEAATAGVGAEERIRSMLEAVRLHLDMDVAFVSEFAGGRRYFRHVDSRSGITPPAPGDSDRLAESYCHAVATGVLPELIHDASRVPEARALPASGEWRVGAHLSVPIRLPDGHCYGTFCCFSAKADHSLTPRDLQVMRVFADLAASEITQQLNANAWLEDASARVRGVLSGDVLATHYQPIVHTTDNRAVGFEALSRFNCTPARTPDKWFIEAEQVGLGVALESLAIQSALRGLSSLPEDVYIAINVTPATIVDGLLERSLGDVPLHRVVLEVTEHSIIEHYQDIARVVGALRERGLRVAVDDAGAGYASFKHILSLAPDLIKLDLSIIRDIDRDSARYSLAAALARFAQDTGSRIVAEGVETDTELEALRNLGVEYAQGYLLGRPMPLEAALQASFTKRAPLTGSAQGK